MDTTVATLLARFQTEFQEYHNFSADWRRDQTRNITLLFDHCGKTDAADLDADDFRAFLGHLLGLGRHPNTVRKNANQIRTFVNWLYDLGAIDADRYLGLKRVQNPKGSTGQGTPRPYTRKELRALWASLDERWPLAEERYLRRFFRGTSPYNRVNKHAVRLQLTAVLRLALDCGLRCKEIYNASLDDIHYDNDYVVVRHGKGRAGGVPRVREVPHTDASRAAVREWIEFRALLDPPHDFPWLILTVWGFRERPGRWCNRLPERRFEELLLNHLSPRGQWELHRLRHTCATEWLRAGVPLEVVSRLLGHSTIAQTLVYAEIVSDDIHRAVNQAQARFAAAVGGPGTEAQTPVGS